VVDVGQVSGISHVLAWYYGYLPVTCSRKSGRLLM